jgi:hypothetical protein
MSKVLANSPDTDMERCIEDHYEDQIDRLKKASEIDRLEQLMLTIELVQQMIKPTLRGGYVSICIDDTDGDGDATSNLFQGMGAALLAAGGTAGKWYSTTPPQRQITLTLPSGRVIESIQRMDEVQDG